MAIKDYFSKQSKVYAAFRPTYPEELYGFVYKRVNNFANAWDCATGNGQVARQLCHKFEKVYATDISQKQLDEAFTAPNIIYSVSPAESTTFANQMFDLITVGQALHWLNTQQFFQEVKRVGKKGATLAVWGYALLNVNPSIDAIFNEFYFNTVGKYWDGARRLVEEEYANIEFPFANKEEAKFTIKLNWNLETFAGYLTSWSATQKYIQANDRSPVPEFIESVMPLWRPDEIKEVRFPVFLKSGTI
jgi:hypothetical protein